MKKMIWLLVLGGMLQLLATFYITNKNNEDTDKLQKSTDKVNNTANNLFKQTNEIKRLTDNLTTRTSQISGSTIAILEAQKNIENLNKTVLAYTDQIKQLSTEIKRDAEYEYSKNSTTGTFVGIVPDTTRDIILLAGTNQLEYTAAQLSSSARALSIFGHQVTFRILKGKLVVTATITDPQGQVIFDMVDNEWLSTTDILHKNYNNSGLEIVDRYNKVVFSVYIRTNNTVLVQGVFYSPQAVTIFSETGMHNIPNADPNFAERYWKARNSIKPIFKHRGKNSFGQTLS